MAEKENRKRDLCDGYCFDFRGGWAEICACEVTRFLGVRLHMEGGRDVLSQAETKMLADFLVDASAWLERQFDKTAWLPKGLVVYVIRDGSGQHKIGKAVDVAKRARQLQTGNGRRLEVAAWLPCPSEQDAYEVEEVAQQLLSVHRGIGEWFSCDLNDAVSALNEAARLCEVHSQATVTASFAVTASFTEVKAAVDRFIDAELDGRLRLEATRDRHVSAAKIDSDAARMLWDVWVALIGVQQDMPDGCKSALVQMLKKYSFDEIVAGMKLACEKHLAPSTDASPNSGKLAFSAIAKHCRIAKLNAENPVDGRRRYVIGILRNRCGYLNTGHAASLISSAIDYGVSIDYMEECAKHVTSWTQFQGAVREAVDVVTTQASEQSVDSCNPYDCD